jgi:penicillin-binding protein 1A
MAVVLETSDQSARIGFQPGREPAAPSARSANRHHHARRRQMGEARRDRRAGKTPTAVSQVLSPGDVVYADPLQGRQAVEGQYRLRQLPEFPARWW